MTGLPLGLWVVLIASEPVPLEPFRLVELKSLEPLGELKRVLTARSLGEMAGS